MPVTWKQEPPARFVCDVEFFNRQCFVSLKYLRDQGKYIILIYCSVLCKIIVLMDEFVKIHRVSTIWSIRGCISDQSARRRTVRQDKQKLIHSQIVNDIRCDCSSHDGHSGVANKLHSRSYSEDRAFLLLINTTRGGCVHYVNASLLGNDKG